MFNEIIWPVIALGGLGLVLGLGLAIASKLLAVSVDPKIETVRTLLPGANCGGCGYPGCDGFAKAIVEGKANLSQCSVLDEANFKQIAGLLGIDAEAGEKMVARIICQGDSENCRTKYKYSGYRRLPCGRGTGGRPVIMPVRLCRAADVRQSLSVRCHLSQ